MKKYCPPATPISHQERAKSAEHPKKAKRSENNVHKTILKKYLSDEIFSRKVFGENIFSPATPISHQERGKSAEYPKKQRSEKKFLNNFKKYIFQM